MEKIILIRYGEIFLKGNNRRYFEDCLIKNIKHSLLRFKYVFSKSQGRYIVENYDENDENEIVDALLKVFGIHSISLAEKIDTNLDKIKQSALLICPDEATKFRVTVRRADKKIQISSTEIAADIGEFIIERKNNMTVDLFKYDLDINIDIRENGYTYLFTKKLLGLEGMPVGCSGKGLLLLSGGIDSPVAGFMMSKRGLSLEAIHFHSMPYTSEMAKEKVVNLAKIISAYTGNIKLYMVPFTEIQEAIHTKCPSEFMITIMRRIMMRISERVATANACGCIISGESLGQVASQTLTSIQVTNSVIEKLPVFRPLIGMDKCEIIDISKKINTFETSILPYEDCCTIFLPKNPATKPKLETVVKAEKFLLADELIEKALANIEIVNI
ncbi:MAG: tRNA uracil 4-sulfurtransferase ThiI [Clostridia bacterium]